MSQDKDLLISQLLKKLDEANLIVTKVNAENTSLKLDKENLLMQNKTLEHENENLLLENEKQITLIFEYQKKVNELLKKLENSKEKNNILKIQRFVSKSEVLNPKSKTNSSLIRSDITEADHKENVVSTVSKKRGRKSGGSNFSKIDLSSYVNEVRYENPSEEFCLECNGSLSMFKEKERYVIETIPSKIKVIKIISRICKCSNCSKTNNKIYYPLSSSVFPGSILTPSFAAYLAYHKYELGIPFHHLVSHFKNVLQIDISKQLMCSWMKLTANKLNPLFDKMKLDLLHNNAKVIHADETTLVVSKKPSEDAERKKCYVYVYSSSYYDKQIHIYDFHESRSIDKTAKWLSGYDGSIVCDDFAGYSKLTKNNPNIKLQRCWAHARRRFVEMLKSIIKRKPDGSVAADVLSLIDKLFSFEAEYKTKRKLPSEIVRLRKIDHIPVLDKIKELIFNTRPKPESALEGAINYIKKNWDEYLTYLDNGYIEISNNLCERAVKPFALNRKMFMTSGSYGGAKITTTLFSIIRTAMINLLDVSKYIEYVLSNIDNIPLNDLLPYSDKLPNYLRVKIN